jgi:protein involved in polysaccharide export with SLBB domain
MRVCSCYLDGLTVLRAIALGGGSTILRYNESV